MLLFVLALVALAMCDMMSTGYGDLLFAYNAAVKDFMQTDSFVTAFGDNYDGAWSLFKPDVVTHNLDMVTYPKELQEGGVLDLALRGERDITICWAEDNAPYAIPPATAGGDPTGFDIEVVQGVMAGIGAYYGLEGSLPHKFVNVNAELLPEGGFSPSFITAMTGDNDCDIWQTGSSLQNWRKSLSYATMNYFLSSRALTIKSDVPTIADWSTYTDPVCVEQGTSNETDFDSYFGEGQADAIMVSVPVTNPDNEEDETWDAQEQMVLRLALDPSADGYCAALFSGTSAGLNLLKEYPTELGAYGLQSCPIESKLVEIVSYIRADEIDVTAGYDEMSSLVNMAAATISGTDIPDWLTERSGVASVSLPMPADLPAGSLIRDIAARGQITWAHGWSETEGLFEHDVSDGTPVMDNLEMQTNCEGTTYDVCYNGLSSGKQKVSGDDADLALLLAKRMLNTLGINTESSTQGSNGLECLAIYHEDENTVNEGLLSAISNEDIYPPIGFVYDNTVYTPERHAVADLTPIGTVGASAVCRNSAAGGCQGDWLNYLNENPTVNVCLTQNGGFLTPLMNNLLAAEGQVIECPYTGEDTCLDKLDGGDCDVYFVDTSFAVNVDTVGRHVNQDILLGTSPIAMTYVVGTHPYVEMEFPPVDPEDPEPPILMYISLGATGLALVLSVVALIIGCSAKGAVTKVPNLKKNPMTPV
ncbi:hypothetical protein KIPB_007877 [Kipferlia bialata]|uniref:Solute-binding protein family 3/N-terminal domain-containing protein n=1 Tax=Kipferlia bialata TaxID=797122 RepID=A0A9K3D0W3_9EUKA|nr:hypothetical protein KIPB_007877 [Kipferlia bialata]|eukprot:g7877.t1